LKLQIAGFDKVGRMMFNGKRMFDYRTNALIYKYGSSFFALLSFLVQGPSAISTTSAIIPRSSLGDIIISGKASPFRTRACTAVVNECNQVIQTAHACAPEKRSNKSK
jgi:hypothetical protein